MLIFFKNTPNKKALNINIEIQVIGYQIIMLKIVLSNHIFNDFQYFI